MAKGILVVLLALIGIAVIILTVGALTGLFVINEEAQGGGVVIRVEEDTSEQWGETTGGNVQILDMDGFTTFLASLCGLPGLVLIFLWACALVATAWGLSH